MTTDNDQATVDRLCLLTYTSDQEGEPHDCVECADAARAIIDAIRKGEVPGVVTDDMIQTTKLMVYEAALEEIVALRAEVAELKRELQKDWEANCCDLMADAQREKARADKAEAEAAKCNDLCAEIGGDDPAECLEIVKAGADMHLAVVKEADRATAERDRLAGLLGDTPSKWSAWSAAAGATPVDFGTRPCGICGERVRVTLSGAWREYHDCKPVPLARLEQALRERDEARSDAEGRKRFEQWYAESMAERDQKEEECSFYLQDRNRIAGELMLMKTLFEQAVALLREAPDKACDCEEGRTCGSCEYNTRKDAFLAGQRAPVASMATSQLSADGKKAYLYDNAKNAWTAADRPVMVKLTVDDAMVERAWSAWINCEPDGLPGMRVALVAALEGKSLAGLERARKGEG